MERLHWTIYGPDSYAYSVYFNRYPAASHRRQIRHTWLVYSAKHNHMDPLPKNWYFIPAGDFI